MITKGSRVFIKSEYQDNGDATLVWVACDDEYKGRISIKPINTGLPFPPVSIALVEMLEQNEIVTYYDRHFRTWVAFYVDAEGNQVGDCEYHVNKQQCIENLKRFINYE